MVDGLRQTLAWVVAIVIVFGNGSARASETATDSVSGGSSAIIDNNQYSFNYRQLIVPTALLAAGVTYVFVGEKFKHSFNSTYCYTSFGGHKTNADSYLQFLPGAGYLTLGFIPGVKHRSDFRERLMAGVSAYVVNFAACEIFKFAFHERRPDTGRHDSFPSGHTARAFTGAELMRIEYGNLVGLSGYAVAIAVGALRVWNNRHWINDVVGGSAIGILSARLGYWLLPWERRVFGLDKKPSAAGTNLFVVPAFGNYWGLTLSASF